MPNFCWNSLTIQGKDDDLREFVKKNIGQDACYAGKKQNPKEYFCFNAMVPVPEEIKKQGYCMAGYDWQSDHWGVKWDILLDAESILDSIVGGNLLIIFDTDWNPPLEWLKTVCPQFPKLNFYLYYAEPGNRLAGEWMCKNGKISEIEYSEEKVLKMYGNEDD